MEHEAGGRRAGALIGALLTIALTLLLTALAQAAPFHPRTESLDVTGLNHACGVAVDNKGDLYASSAGDSKVKVYNSSHTLLTEISDANTPCGLAVTTKGILYVTERTTGEVVRFKPNAYPFSGTPTYGSREVVDSSKKAKGIAVDPFDNRLYVTEGDHVAVYTEAGSFEANLGEGTLSEATGVAAYAYTAGLQAQRHLWVADAGGEDRLYLFEGNEAKALSLRRELNGSTTPDGSFGFGTAGAYLAADPGDRTSGGECKAVGEEACTSGHLFLYDAAHKALDEFDASGEYLDRTVNASFADAEPTQVAIDRSGGSADGTLYVSAGAGSGAKALAFGPLKAPTRKTLKKPSEEAGGLSQELKEARAVAVDSHGDLYAAAGGEVRVYDSSGKELLKFEDSHKPVDLAVDSTGKVYVLDENKGFVGEDEVTYYTPSKYPPDSATTYTRHAPVAVSEDFSESPGILEAIAVDPGPGGGKDRLFVTGFATTHEYDSAANNSELLEGEFASCITITPRVSIAVDGARGIVYIARNPSQIFAVSEETGECLRRFENTGPAKAGGNPLLAVDQANGHLLTFDGVTPIAREYDAAGGYAAGFGKFTEGLSTVSYRVAVDSACATHEPPLDETTTPTCKEYDPANGTAYVAFADTSATHPPYNGVNAFGPLRYAQPEKHKLTVEKTGNGSGTVTSEPAGISCETCSAEFDETEVVKLTAKADEASESKFEGWTGCEAEETISPTEGTCEVTMSKARTVSAEFHTDVEDFELEVEIVGLGSGEVTSEPSEPVGIECPVKCTAEFGKNVKVSLKAKADKESEFVKWSGCDSVNGKKECLLSLTANRKVTVEFDVLHPLLTVVLNGGGTGTVSSEPLGIDCLPTCSHKFELDDEVTLTAEPEPGSVFAGWGEGDCDAETVSEGEGTCEVEMSEAREVTATFAALPQAIAKPAQPILYHEATLRGEVNPSGLATEYRFEYLSEEEFEDNGETFEGAAQTPVGKLASGSEFVAVAAPLLGLEEGTEYRFMLRAMNAVGPAEDEGQPFETLQRRKSPPCANSEYRTGFSANLPDCRAYELVTPAQTNGLVPAATGSGTSLSGGFSNWLTVQREEGAGELLSYFTNGTLPGFEGNGILDGYRAEREAGGHPAGGWHSVLFSPSYTEADAGAHASHIQLGISSDQLYSNWEINHEPETFPDTLAHGVYLHGPAGFEALGQGSLGEDLGALSRYLSAGGEHAIFRSNAHLEPEAPPAPNGALYDREAGSASAHVLTVPPSNASAEEEAEFLAALRSKEQAKYAGASEDGATVAFKVGVGLYVSLDDATVERLSPRTARTGDTLSCAAGPLYEGQNQLQQRHFQWLRNGAAITGASGGDVSNTPDYTAKPADEGAALQCLTVATESNPHSVAVSAPVWIAPLEAGQAPQPPTQVAAPTPAGPGPGTLETCNPGSWTGATSFAYQWYADGKAITGATSQTYEVQAGDVPGMLQCIVRGTNAAAAVARASALTATSPAPAQAAPAATAQALPKTIYAGASEDGRYVFFAYGSGESPGRLFRFDTQAESAEEIAGSGLFAGISGDGTHAFFTSTEALTGGEENENGEEAEPGTRNLYGWSGAGARFIGALPEGDFEQNAFGSPSEANLTAWTRAINLIVGEQSGRSLVPTRSTPDGSAFVFQSHARLTAYDNKGIGEIYHFDPTAAAGERLLCVSCDPTGASPSADALLADVRGLTGDPITTATAMTNVTDDGQEVFFQSFDRLLPEDANEAEDVYEWQANGVEGCTRPGGCLALISSGQGELASYLYAMSADGHDVFIQTKEKLVGADLAGSPSIYDARVGGGIPESPVPVPCQDDACQGSGSEPPALPVPATTGPGEEAESTPPPPHCAKGKHRVKGRCVRVKHHRKRHRRAHANRRGSR